MANNKSSKGGGEAVEEQSSKSQSCPSTCKTSKTKTSVASRYLNWMRETSSTPNIIKSNGKKYSSRSTIPSSSGSDHDPKSHPHPAIMDTTTATNKNSSENSVACGSSQVDQKAIDQRRGECVSKLEKKSPGLSHIDHHHHKSLSIGKPNRPSKLDAHAKIKRISNDSSSKAVLNYKIRSGIRLDHQDPSSSSGQISNKTETDQLTVRSHQPTQKKKTSASHDQGHSSSSESKPARKVPNQPNSSESNQLHDAKNKENSRISNNIIGRRRGDPSPSHQISSKKTTRLEKSHQPAQKSKNSSQHRQSNKASQVMKGKITKPPAAQQTSKRPKKQYRSVPAEDDKSDSSEAEDYGYGEEYITWNGSWSEGIGWTCPVCDRDLGNYWPSGSETQDSSVLPEVAILPCGHFFHYTCFNFISDLHQATADPPCFLCFSILPSTS